MSSYSDFHKYLMAHLTVERMSYLETLFQSAKRFVYILKNPTKASYEELLYFTDCLEEEPATIYETQGVCLETLSEREVQELKEVRSLREYVNQLALEPAQKQ